MGALIPIFIQVLPELFKVAKDVPVIFDFIKQSKQVFENEGEWTPEAEAKFSAELQSWKTNPPDWLKTDDQL